MMKFKAFLFCNILLVVTVIGQTNKALFDNFIYKGHDAFFEKKINPLKQYTNPIIAGFYPDPSICRKGDDYYLVHSSFSFYPGIPIWHSKDLVNWQQIGYVLTQSSQLQLKGLNISEGIFAPTIRYNKHNNTFYVICTVVGGIGNFIVKTQDITKGWSEPILLPQVKGIDPSIFFDDDDKAYIVNCGEPKQAQWNGNRATWMYEYDIATDKIINSGKIIANGGIDTAQHPVWQEAPHQYKINGKYYLMTAEGGTGTNHSEVIFESDKVDGPYKPCVINPILTQRDLPNDRSDMITCAGHADLIETNSGKWYAVFLATRPYNYDFYGTGRETFLLPVTWEKGTPVILKKATPIPVVVNANLPKINVHRPSGNFIWRDDFNKTQLAQEWNTLRSAPSNWLTFKNGYLELAAIDKSINEKVTPAFVARRQQHTAFTVATTLNFQSKTSGELAGLVYFQNEKFYLLVGKTFKDGKPLIVLQSRKNGITETLVSKAINNNKYTQITLQMEVDKGKCAIYYQLPKAQKHLLAKDIDVTHITTKLAGGFVGSYIGLYATSVFEQ